MNVEKLIEDPPMNAWDVADLYSWSTNYEAGDGPFTLFLDMIGYSDEEFGQALYGPTIRYAENFRTGSWNERLGYVEIDKLGRALMQYAVNPHAVEQYVAALMEAEGEE